MSQNKHRHGCCADKCCNDATCMELPEGKRCGDCVFFKHCAAFYDHKPDDTFCDFYPRRFRQLFVAAGGGPGVVVAAPLEPRNG